MNSQTLVIYDFKILYEILYELKKHINFNIINIDKKKNLDLLYTNKSHFLIISKKKLNTPLNQILLEKFPIEIFKLIETVNINFLKTKFEQQSKIDIGKYILDLNSRKISTKDKSLNLTERETNIITFLNNEEKPIKISKLQTEVWGHNSKLETHTVETHIYRLRKKISKTFDDNNFIRSSKLGYSIK